MLDNQVKQFEYGKAMMALNNSTSICGFRTWCRSQVKFTCGGVDDSVVSCVNE